MELCNHRFWIMDCRFIASFRPMLYSVQPRSCKGSYSPRGSHQEENKAEETLELEKLYANSTYELHQFWANDLYLILRETFVSLSSNWGWCHLSWRPCKFLIHISRPLENFEDTELLILCFHGPIQSSLWSLGRVVLYIQYFKCPQVVLSTSGIFVLRTLLSHRCFLLPSIPIPKREEHQNCT